MKRLITVVLITVAGTGCSLGASAGDHITLTGTPAGMNAFGDFLNGAVRTGKESPKQPSEYFQHRSNEMQQETARHAQGFWQKLSN